MEITRNTIFCALGLRRMLLLFLAAACLPAAAAPSVRILSSDASPEDTTHTLATPPPACRLVVVEPRDRLSSLAARYGVPVKQLLQLNPGLGAAWMQPGEALRVPCEPCTATLQGLEREILRGPRGDRRIAFTFDCAWSSADELDRLLRLLARHEVRATFFLTGIFLKTVPSAPLRIARAGHSLGNHSMTHPWCTQISDDRIRAELAGVEDRVTSAARTGAGPADPAPSTRPFWRPPYGDRDGRVLRAAAAAGYRSIAWSIDTLDWQEEPVSSPDNLFRRVCKRPFETAGGDPDPLDGAIVLMHLAGRNTPAALERIFPHLRERGYRFVTVPQLLEP